MEDGFAVAGNSDRDVEQSRHKEVTSEIQKRDVPVKNWCFTWFYDNERPKPSWPDTQFLAYQPEICPDSGRYHLQGYVQFKQKKRLSQLKKLQNEIHWERREGTHKQALVYVTKDETRVMGTEPIIEGEAKVAGNQGAGYAALQADLAAGMSVTEVVEEHFSMFMRHHRAINEVIALQEKPRDVNVPVYTTVLWGPPGTGKTYQAQEEAGSDVYWLSQPNNAAGALWWDGYTGQKNVIIDEFTGWIPREVMCRILDCYPMRIQKKGGMCQLQATRFWICSNKPPQEWWPKSYQKDGLGPIARRIDGDRGTVILKSVVYKPGALHAPTQIPVSTAWNPDPGVGDCSEEDDGMNGFGQYVPNYCPHDSQDFDVT